MVLAAKGGVECRHGVTVSILFADLQEMQNHMRATVDQGLAELQARQGEGGLPAEPRSAKGPTEQAHYAASAPLDPNVASELSAQAQEADRAERDTLSQAGPGDQNAGSNPEPVARTPTARLELGQTLDEVIAILGQPKDIVDLGAKQIYVFNGLKVTIANGRVGAID